MPRLGMPGQRGFARQRDQALRQPLPVAGSDPQRRHAELLRRDRDALRAVVEQKPWGARARLLPI